MMQAAANATAGLIGLGIFVTFWTLVALMLIGKKARDEAARNALIPFKDGSHD
jgi:hypothetical protein